MVQCYYNPENCVIQNLYNLLSYFVGDIDVHDRTDKTYRLDKLVPRIITTQCEIFLEDSDIQSIVETQCLTAYYSIYNQTYVTLYSHETCLFLGKLVYDRGSMYKIEDIKGVT